MIDVNTTSKLSTDNDLVSAVQGKAAASSRDLRTFIRHAKEGPTSSCHLIFRLVTHHRMSVSQDVTSAAMLTEAAATSNSLCKVMNTLNRECSPKPQK